MCELMSDISKRNWIECKECIVNNLGKKYLMPTLHIGNECHRQLWMLTFQFFFLICITYCRSLYKVNAAIQTIHGLHEFNELIWNCQFVRPLIQVILYLLFLNKKKIEAWFCKDFLQAILSNQCSKDIRIHTWSTFFFFFFFTNFYNNCMFSYNPHRWFVDQLQVVNLRFKKQWKNQIR